MPTATEAVHLLNEDLDPDMPKFSPSNIFLRSQKPYNSKSLAKHINAISDFVSTTNALEGQFHFVPVDSQNILLATAKFVNLNQSEALIGV